jgi:hypothetical protein
MTDTLLGEVLGSIKLLICLNLINNREQIYTQLLCKMNNPTELSLTSLIHRRNTHIVGYSWNYCYRNNYSMDCAVMCIPKLLSVYLCWLTCSCLTVLPSLRLMILTEYLTMSPLGLEGGFHDTMATLVLLEELACRSRTTLGFPMVKVRW